MDNPDIPNILEKLISILGRIVLTCPYDIKDKSAATAKSLVLLTQSHSSTVAHELMNLLRTLHGILGWNQSLNAMLMQKLNLAAYFLSEVCLNSAMHENQTSDQQHFMVVACLNVIGAWDVRPRIGALVEIDNSQGTVIGISTKGKLCVQIHETAELKKIPVQSLKILKDIEFNFDKMPLGESFVKTWANLFLIRNTYTQERKFYHGKQYILYEQVN